MKNLLISGFNGFVGYNLKLYLENDSSYNLTGYNRNDSSFQLSSKNIIVHLAGKSHDLQYKQDFKDYYISNFELTKKIFDDFLNSDASKFIFISSVKSVADSSDYLLNEKCIPNPQSYYGKSKLLAEQYLLKNITPEKKLFILRPCMIYGPKNKGNLNSLSNLISLRLPWLLGSYSNKRSFCSVHNLCYVIKQLIDNDNVLNGIYNISDDGPISTNDLIKLISKSMKINILIINLPKFIIEILAKIGDKIKYFPINSERLFKLTESFIISNDKIKTSLNLKEMPISTELGIEYLFDINASKKQYS